MKKILVLAGLCMIFISCNKQAAPTKQKEQQEVVEELNTEKAPLKKLNVTIRQQHAPESSYLLVEGVYEKAKNNYDTAEQLLKRAIALDSLNDAAHYELAALYRTKEKNSIEDALVHIKQASIIDPENTWYKALLGQFYVDAGQTEQGINLLKALSKENPKEIKYQYDLAYSYEQAQQYQNAINVYNDIENKHGFNAEIKHHKHQAYFAMQEYDKGIKEIEDIVEKDETHTSYSSFLADYFFKKGDLSKSKYYLQKVFDQDERDVRGNVVGVKIATIEERQADIIKHLDNLFTNVELSKAQCVELLVPLIGVASEFPTSTKTIIQILEKYSKQGKPNSKLFTMLGDFYTNSNEYEKAIHSFREAAKSEKEVPYPVHRQLLLLQSHKGDYSNLQIDAKRAMNAYPKEFLPYYFSGFANYQLKKYASAITELEKASTFNKERSYLLGDVYFYLGESYMELQQKEKAYQAFDKALEKAPENEIVLNNYAYYLAQNKQQLDKALTLAQKAVLLNKQNANVHDTYAYVLFQRAEYEEALVQNQIAFDLDQNKKASIAEHLGDCYSQLGETDKAIEYWKIAIERGANSPKLIEKITKKKYIE